MEMDFELTSPGFAVGLGTGRQRADKRENRSFRPGPWERVLEKTGRDMENAPHETPHCQRFCVQGGTAATELEGFGRCGGRL